MIELPGRAVGVITPSANIVVERVAIGLLRSFPAIGLHFARTPARGSVDPYPDGYDTEAMLRAAELLADAGPDIVVWAGSKGVLVGVEQDEALCRAIQATTGVRATTPTIALRDLAPHGARRRAVLVTPYTTPYQQRLIEGFARLGIACVAEAHAGIADNLDYASIKPDRIHEMTRQAMRNVLASPDMILVWCTNFAGAAVARDLEDEFDLPVIDATLLGLQRALSVLEIDLSKARAWGSLFGTPPALFDLVS